MIKRKDIMVFIVVGIFAAIFSVIISKFFFTSGGQRNLTAEKVQAITAEFKTPPDPTVFNDQAIDPTKLIEIGDNNNSRPF